MPHAADVGLRWTIGDVSTRGFEALRLSIWGAWRIFGPRAAYGVCVNSVSLGEARARTGSLPGDVAWHVSDGRLPSFLKDHLDDHLAEGVAWKFAPLRLFPERYELAFDNDCILWAMPTAIRQWLRAAEPRDLCVLAEDVAPAFGQFARFCGSAPRNTGIRGLPPGFDMEGALRNVLAAYPVRMTSELDEQGLQVAALSVAQPPLAVRHDEVSICSPFPPHQQELGTCGVHFVGLNMKAPRPWYDQRALDRIGENWDAHRSRLYEAVDAPLEAHYKRFSRSH